MVDTRFKKGQIPWNKDKIGVYKLSKETKKRIKLSKLGIPHWTKYKKFSEESRNKMRESAKRAWLNPDLKKKQSEAHKGQISPRKGVKLNPEQVKKHQAFMKEYWKTHKNPMLGEKGGIPWNKGKSGYLSQDQLKRMSEKQKDLMSNLEFRKRNGEAVSKALSRPEAREKMIEIRNRPEVIANSRKQMIERIKKGKYSKISNTLPERMIKNELMERGYIEEKDFVHQYNLYETFVCDFCFPIQKVIIEVDGDFYHRNPIKYAGKKIYEKQRKSLLTDKRKEAYIKVIDNGSWTLLRFWESDIKKDVVGCVDKIVKVLKSKKISQQTI